MEKGTNGINDLEEGERLRFSTTNDAQQNTITARSQDKGFFNIEYLTDTDDYDAAGEKQKMKYIMAKTMVKTLISLVMILPMHNLITAVLIITLSALKRRSLRMQVKLSLI